jgi:FlaG/FlaF family flagellin (archaellin)
MKFGGFINKRAVSAVIATVLVIMITVAAVSILWSFLIPMIKDNLSFSDLCENTGVSIISSQGYTCYKPNNITIVQVSKSNSDANVTGLIFSISSSGNSYDYDEQKVAYSNSEYSVYYLNTSEFEKIEKLSVVPVVKSGNSEKSCSALSLDNIPLCSANINLGEVSFGRLINRAGGNGNGNGNGDDDSGDGNIVIPPMGDTNNDGYIEIHSCEQLQNISNNLTANYILLRNIDCSNTSTGVSIWNEEGFVPIAGIPVYDWVYGSGDVVAPGDSFSGNFNGNNHIINNLYINRPAEDYIGLFVYSTGNISNVGLINLNITGNSEVGGLVGFNSGVINNSYATGNVTGSVVGGLVGQQYGSALINNSYANVMVIGSGYAVGGLVGLQTGGTIYNSYSTGDVFGLGQSTGGLVGGHFNSPSGVYLGGSIYNSYSTGNVTGNQNVGGLIGSHENGVISNSYSTGNVTGNQNVGGFVGTRYGGTISNSYSTGTSSGNGFIAYTAYYLYFNSFWDVETSGVGSSGDYNLGANGRTTDEMKMPSTFTGVGFEWDTNIWNLTLGEYPKLKWQN